MTTSHKKKTHSMVVIMKKDFVLKKTFKEQAASLVRVINELGSPFLDDNDELLALDTWNVLDESVVNTVQEVCSLGKDQYAKYCKEVITDCTQSIHEPIKKIALPLFSRPKPKKKKAAYSRVMLYCSLTCTS